MLNWNSRDIAIIVRDALQMYEQQASQSGPTTLIGELEGEASAGLRAIQALIDDMARQRRIWLANDMTAKLADDKAAMPAGDFSRARWLEIEALFNAFAVWMETPLVVWPADPATGSAAIALAPIVIVSRRGNPPAQPTQEVTDVQN